MVAGVVDSNGGSGHLLKILNRLGACVSSDTLSRYQQHRVKQLEKAGIMSEYPSTVFTVLSTNSRVLSDVPSLGTSKLEDFQADITEQATLLNFKQPVCTHCSCKQSASLIDFQS